MKSPNNRFLRTELDSLIPYTPGEQPNIGEVVIKLNTNENPYPPSPKIKLKIDEIIEKGLLRKYPNYNAQNLRQSIARQLHLNPEQILVTNGSDEALRLLFQAVLAPKDILVAPDPTYSLYPVLTDSLMADIQFKKIPLLQNLHFDFESLKNQPGKLLAFAHPNAPTGILEPKEDLLDLIAKFNGLVLADEAYIDFAGSSASLVSEIRNFPNLLVSRTFSKSYSLAGLRVGFLIGEESLIQMIQKLKDSYNVGLLEQEIALCAFEDIGYFQEKIGQVISERNRLTNALREMDFFIPESSANFIFCKPKSGISPEWIYQSLKAKNVLVRYFSKGISKDYVRISIGSESENNILLQELQTILK